MLIKGLGIFFWVECVGQDGKYCPQFSQIRWWDEDLYFSVYFYDNRWYLLGLFQVRTSLFPLSFKDIFCKLGREFFFREFRKKLRRN